MGVPGPETTRHLSDPPPPGNRAERLAGAACLTHTSMGRPDPPA